MWMLFREKEEIRDRGRKDNTQVRASSLELKLRCSAMEGGEASELRAFMQVEYHETAL